MSRGAKLLQLCGIKVGRKEEESTVAVDVQIQPNETSEYNLVYNE